MQGVDARPDTMLSIPAVSDTNPYAPYADLAALMSRCSIKASDLHSWTTEAMLVYAAKLEEWAEHAKRELPKREPPKRGGAPKVEGSYALPPGIIDGPPHSTRSFRVALGVETAVDARAKIEGTTTNALVNRWCREYLCGIRP